MIRAQHGYPFVVSLILDIALLAALMVTISLTGCNRKEKVLEINTPGADVNVIRDKDTGRVDVDVKR